MLKGVQRITLEAGESQEVVFEISSDILDQVNEKGEKGVFIIARVVQ